MDEALDGTVVEVPVADPIAGRREGRPIDDLHLVIVRADVDAATRLVEDGVIAAVVTDAQPMRLGPGREAKELMPEADPQDRRATLDRVAGQLADDRDLACHPRRIARP